MARTTEMRLIELMTLKQDISNVIEYLGKKGNFQFKSKQKEVNESKSELDLNIDKEFFDNLQKARIFLEIKDIEEQILTCASANDEDRKDASEILGAVSSLRDEILLQQEETKKVCDAYKEALSFSNLQLPYSELDHLSFLTLKIGKIDPANIKPLQDALGVHGIIVPLGNDKSKVLAASSKKGRFALNTELKKYGFVNMEIPENFKGIPSDVLESLKLEKTSAQEKLDKLIERRNNFAETHKDKILHLIKAFAVGMQVKDIQNSLESTSLVYRLTGWIPANECTEVIKELDNLTEGRIAIRQYLPHEVASVVSGEEQVPVKLKHGKFVASFERMILSYGSPIYGTIDPTPLVAIFFTLLFGMMFGDLGQGLVFLIAGILMLKNIVKVGGWNKFAPIFMAIGISSSIMGLITGEFFGTEKLLEPFAHFVTGLFGTPRAPIVKMMPSSDPNSIKVMFGVFGIAIAVGFIINSVGLIINIINKLVLKKYGEAFFGKAGLSGALFFWYVIVFAIRIAAFKHSPQVYDWIIIGTTLFFAAFGEPFERLIEGHRPVMENGFGAMVITGIVELIEVISNYMSNTVSFLRVGAFALAHAVLGYIIHTMSSMSGGIGAILILIIGNVIVVVLEGMIVAIQVIRLQYYEFFSKFFNETGAEFSPIQFHYGNK